MAMVEEEKEEEIEEEEDEEEEIERTWGEHGPSVLQPSSAVPARARHRLACGWKSSLVGWRRRHQSLEAKAQRITAAFLGTRSPCWHPEQHRVRRGSVSLGVMLLRPSLIQGWSD